MIADALLEFSKGQAVASGVSDNVVDQGAAGDSYKRAFVAATVSPDVAGGTSLQASVETSDNNSAFVTVLTGEAVTTADLKAGKPLLKTVLPLGLKRYIRLKYVAAAAQDAPFTAGKINAGIALDVDVK
jgi:hypothetical protein